MTSYKQKTRPLDDDAKLKIRALLDEMVSNSAYATESTYSADSTQYPDNLIPFTDKHLSYLLKHPATDPQQYLSNLRLKTKIT